MKRPAAGRRATSTAAAETLTGFAAAPPGLESALARELAAIGVSDGSQIAGGVEFTASPAELWRVNLASRIAGRVLVRVASFHASAFHELERHAEKIDWRQFAPASGSVHFRVTTKRSKLYHERAIVERLVAAVTRQIPTAAAVVARGEAALEDEDPTRLSATQRFVVRLWEDECLISADASGAPLHRRGYRIDVAKAPIRETLAAGLLLAAGWDGTAALTDPMCGAGTIPIEAALLARRIAPGLRRRFAFERWPGFDVDEYRAVRAGLEAAILPAVRIRIAGSDRDAGAIGAARANAERAGVDADIEWRRAAISDLTPPPGSGWVVTNPPYGARVGDRAALRNLYAQLGNVLRRQAPGASVAMVSADRMLEGQTGLEWRELVATENGGIRVRFVAADVPG